MSWTELLQRIAANYSLALAGVGNITMPAVRVGCSHVFHL